MTGDVKPLSTSALAKHLAKSSKQMFAELEALGWIVREGDSWKLTAKGTFEGGDYKESKRFGTYIVWPASVTEHRALVNPDSQLLTAAAIGKTVSLSAMMVNRLLNEMGWIERHIKGWRLTESGKRQGGRQTEDARSGVPYVLWPSELVEQIPFKDRLSELSVEHVGLERGPVSGRYGCADGHQVTSKAEVQIDNWLYLAGVVHAYQRQLPVAEVAFCDFYIPAAKLYIEYWGSGGDARYLAEKMQKKELYQRYGLTLIELEEKDLTDLDETLSRRLLKLGLETL